MMGYLKNEYESENYDYHPDEDLLKILDYIKKEKGKQRWEERGKESGLIDEYKKREVGERG